jgi:hypothetical protein
MQRKVFSYGSILFGIVLLFSIATQADAQVLFEADFDSGGPANDAANWKAENPAQTWGIEDFAANGTKALKHTSAGCANSGNTPFPAAGMESWTDYIVEMDAAWNDDDSWGIIVRQTAVDKGYLAFFGYIETPHVALADLALGCGKVGECFSEGVNCEGDDSLVIARQDHGWDVATLVRDASVIYRLRVEAVGSSIKISYGEIGKETVLIDVEDSTYAKGGVGIWQESNDNCFIDNIKVTAVRSGVAVHPEGLLTTTWASIKERR